MTPPIKLGSAVVERLKFANEVRIVDWVGKHVFTVHGAEAERLLASKQCVAAPDRKQRTDKPLVISRLMLPKVDPGVVVGHGSNSLKATYLETLEGGEVIRIETSAELPRYVTTGRCQAFKMKKIGRSLEPIYRAALNETVAPFKAEYLKANPVPESVDPVGSRAFCLWPR